MGKGEGEGEGEGRRVYQGECWLLSSCPRVLRSAYISPVFSNAALHWILRDAGARMGVLRGAYEALQTGGTFVFEMGGAGNVAEVHAALIAAIVHQGVGIEEARAKSPWFFPSEQSMKDMLKEAGFEVEKSELVYRPTQLTTEKDGGVKGWVELMGARFFEGLSDERREGAVKEVCDVLETVLTHEEDRSKWLGYVRLRVLARRV